MLTIVAQAIFCFLVGLVSISLPTLYFWWFGKKTLFYSKPRLDFADHIGSTIFGLLINTGAACIVAGIYQLGCTILKHVVR